MSLKQHCAAVVAVVLAAASASFAQFAPPADNKLTEKQMQAYVASMTELRELLTSTGKRVENASALGAMAIGTQFGDKWAATLAKHNLSEEEWSWVHEQATRSWLVAGMVGTAEQDLARQKQEINDRIAAARQKLTQQEQALKSGKRTIRDDDERAGMIEDFKNQQKSASEEAGSYDEQAKQAETEAKEYDAAATTAERQMKSPPADLAGDDRTAYVDEQRTEMTTNRERATEARAREAEAKAAATNARARADALASQAADPTLVLDGEEKATLKDRHQMEIDATRAEIARHEESLAALASAEAMNADLMKQMREGIPQENLDLAKEYSDRIAAALGEPAKK